MRDLEQEWAAEERARAAVAALAEAEEEADRAAEPAEARPRLRHPV